jgi:hypothetical protein
MSDPNYPLSLPWEHAAAKELADCLHFLTHSMFQDYDDCCDRLAAAAERIRETVAFHAEIEAKVAQAQREAAVEAEASRMRLSQWAKSNSDRTLAKDILGLLEDVRCLQLDYARDCLEQDYAKQQHQQSQDDEVLGEYLEAIDPGILTD